VDGPKGELGGNPSSLPAKTHIRFLEEVTSNVTWKGVNLLMKLMVWNCGGGYKVNEKYKKIPWDVDISIIIDCDDIRKEDLKDREEWKKEKEKGKAFAEYQYDINIKNNLGIAAFVYNKKFKLKQEDIIAVWLKQFLVFTINDKIRIVVYYGYPKGANGISDLRYAVDKYKNEFFNDIPLLLCGDFNSNVNKDYSKDRPIHTHGEFEKTISFYGMKSYYDLQYGEPVDKRRPTWRKGNNKNHIDYVYGQEKLFKKDMFEVGTDEWYKCSDHVPLFVKFNDDMLL
jgi:hypothetical protein